MQQIIRIKVEPMCYRKVTQCLQATHDLSILITDSVEICSILVTSVYCQGRQIKIAINIGVVSSQKRRAIMPYDSKAKVAIRLVFERGKRLLEHGRR
ncbi:hypothetical protein [Rosistilla oblonga]|uniref:hypothetical protein n=1 Tax=Rosistilla oblonga TaxID=2527990 RepID=UPI003A98545B